MSKAIKLKGQLASKKKNYEKFLHCILGELLRDGTVKCDGRTNEEVQQEIIDYMDQVTSGPDFKVYEKIGHFPTIIKHARVSARNEDYEISCVFYVMWPYDSHIREPKRTVR